MTTDERNRLRELAAAATPGPWEQSDMVDGASIGGRPHKVWPVDAPFQQDEDGFAGIGVACCILPREDEDAETLRFVPANAAYIAAMHPQAALTLLDALEQAEEELARGRQLVQTQQELIEQFADIQQITALRVWVNFDNPANVRFTAACPDALNQDVTARADQMVREIYACIAGLAANLQARRIAELEAERDALLTPAQEATP